MTVSERAFVFGAQLPHMVGVLTLPSEAKSQAVVIVVGGPQYRAGSHRQFVLLARSLALAGYPVLRFDYRGMGDSGGELKSFLHVREDVEEAITALMRELPAVKQICLWGLCDGASAALMYVAATGDTRVHTICLLNPWVRSEASLAQARVKHYYGSRLRERAFWAKLLSGRVNWRSIAELLRNVIKTVRPGKAPIAKASFQEQMAQGWHTFPGGILLLLSGKDLTAQEFSEAIKTSATWRGAFQRSRLFVHSVPDADHTLSRSEHRREVEEVTVRWLGEQT